MFGIGRFRSILFSFVLFCLPLGLWDVAKFFFIEGSKFKNALVRFEFQSSRVTFFRPEPVTPGPGLQITSSSYSIPTTPRRPTTEITMVPTAAAATKTTTSVPPPTALSTEITSATTTTRKHSSTKASQYPSKTPNNSEHQNPSKTDTNTLSTLVIVVIAVSGGVTAVIIGLAVTCYIWRKQRNARFFIFSSF